MPMLFSQFTNPRANKWDAKKRLEKSLVLQVNNVWQLNRLARSLPAIMMRPVYSTGFKLLRLAGEQMQSGAAKLALGAGRALRCCLKVRIMANH